MMFRSLRARLLVSHLAVALAGTVVVLAAARALVPRLFDDRVRGNGPRAGGGTAAAQQHDAVVSALDLALAIGLAASLVVAIIAAVVTTRRVLRPIEQLRRGTRQIAAGHYDLALTVPGERELGALASDVNELALALAETERRRAALIGDVAHEMRTPLTTITGYLDGVADGLVAPEEMTALASGELARLRRLADDLAAVSRAEEGRLSLEPSAVDLAEIAAAVTRRLRPQAEASALTIDLRASTAVPSSGDRERLVQALTNLVGNAINYTPPGGAIVVTASDHPPRLVVTDTGRGLRPDQTRRVFERFYRAEPGHHAGGTGVGLTIARAIARAHGGELTASSPGPGRGSTFTLTLPSGEGPAGRR